MSYNGLGPIPLPSLDRPFIVELWPLFDKLYSRVIGHPASNFVFVPGATPLSTFSATVTMLTTYYVTVFAGRELMKNREPFKLNALFMVHNLALTIISGVLLALFIEQLAPTIARNGVFYAICDHRGGWTAPLVTLYYVRVSFRPELLGLTGSSSITLPNTSSCWTLSSWSSGRSPSVGQEVLTSKYSADAPSLSPYLSSRGYCSALLHSTHWADRRLLGPHYPQSHRPRSHVLVLLPSCARRAHLVEEMDHQASDSPIRHRPRLRLLCLLHLLLVNILP